MRLILSSDVGSNFKQKFLINYQSVNNNDLFYLQSNKNTLNQITIDNSGMYLINIICQFMEPCSVGLFIDDIEEVVQDTIPFDKYHCMTLHHVLNVKSCNNLTIKYMSLGTNHIINSENEINLWKI